VHNLLQGVVNRLLLLQLAFGVIKRDDLAQGELFGILTVMMKFVLVCKVYIHKNPSMLTSKKVIADLE